MNKTPPQPNDDQSERQLEEILSRVKYIGPEPMPSIDNLAGDVADNIHDIRRDRDNEKRQ